MPLPFVVAPVVITALKIGGTVLLGGGIITYANKKGHDDGYNEGHDKGYREGYVASSRAYEEKYRKLIEDFKCDKNKLRREMNEYEQLCKELLEECEKYERMGYSELADRAKNDYYSLRNAVLDGGR